MNANLTTRVLDFDAAFPTIARREHWLNIYLDHRECGADHSEAVRRIEFERANEVKEPSQKEIEAWRNLESAATTLVEQLGKTTDGKATYENWSAVRSALDELKKLRNPSPAGRWTTRTAGRMDEVKAFDAAVNQKK